jgi:FkbM family methyltransferase
MNILLATAHYGPMLVFEADKVIGLSLRSSGGFQEGRVKEVVDFLREKFSFAAEVFIDVGANIGTHLIYSLKSGIFQRAFGIEPDRNNFRLLTANVQINDLAHATNLFNLALSNTYHLAELELCPANFGDHRIRVAQDENVPSFGETGREVVTVKLATFDGIFATADFDWKRSLIWMDTQGHEGFIFDGARDLFAAHKPYVVTEFWPYGLERSGGKRLYFDFLAQCKSLYDINSSDWTSGTTVSADELEKRYGEMLAATSADHYPHTDLLCIP